MKVIRTAKGSLDPSIAGILTDKISVLTGQSGAGKSTLLNQLEPSFHLATQEISKALGRGKHTTRHNELHEVAGDLWRIHQALVPWIFRIFKHTN